MGEWLEGHVEDFDQTDPVLGDELTSDWETASGPHDIATERDPGESDGDFKERHFTRVALDMRNNVPVA